MYLVLERLEMNQCWIQNRDDIKNHCKTVSNCKKKSYSLFDVIWAQFKPAPSFRWFTVNGLSGSGNGGWTTACNVVELRTRVYRYTYTYYVRMPWLLPGVAACSLRSQQSVCVQTTDATNSPFTRQVFVCASYRACCTVHSFCFVVVLPKLKNSPSVQCNGNAAKPPTVLNAGDSVQERSKHK